MEIATYNYIIQHAPYSVAGSSGITLEAINLANNKRLGFVTVKLLPERERTVLLSKIATSFRVLFRADTIIDYGRNGVGTRLLLDSMIWAKDKGCTALTGNFVPEKELYKTKEWYEKRSVIVTEDLQGLEGYVPAIIASCQAIIAQH